MTGSEVIARHQWRTEQAQRIWYRAESLVIQHCIELVVEAKDKENAVLALQAKLAGYKRF